jgi:hypothetical protein
MKHIVTLQFRFKSDNNNGHFTLKPVAMHLCARKCLVGNPRMGNLREYFLMTSRQAPDTFMQRNWPETILTSHAPFAKVKG